MMDDLNKLGLAEARDALRRGDTTSLALTEACLSAIEGAGALNAFVHHTPEIALEQAAAADRRLATRPRSTATRSTPGDAATTTPS